MASGWKEASDFFKHLNQNDWKWIIGIIATKNRKQLGKYLQQIGTYLVDGKWLSLAKFGGKLASSAAMVAAGAYVLTNSLKSGYDDVKSAITDKDKSDWDKAAAVIKELWMPYQFKKNWGKFFKWLDNLDMKGIDKERMAIYNKYGVNLTDVLNTGKPLDQAFKDLFKKYPGLAEELRDTGMDIPAEWITVSGKAQKNLQSGKDPSINYLGLDINSEEGRVAALKDIHERDKALADKSGYDIRGIQQMPSSDRAKLEKEVDNMAKDKEKKFNDPTWYWKGLAEKLIAGTLTWTSIKSNYDKICLVAFTVADIKLHFPMIDSKLPTKVITNFDALFGALRGPNTGAYNYTSEDVFVYTMELASLIARIKYIQKVIKMAHTHAVEQDDLAKIGVRALSQNNSLYNEIIQYGPNRIARLNAICEEINKWPLVGMSLMSRWNYLAEKCFKDYNGPKAVFGAYRISKVPAFDSTSGSHFSYHNVFNSAGLDQTIADLETEYAAFKSWSGTLSKPNAMLLVAGDFIKLLGTDKSVFNNVGYLDQVQPGKLTFDFDQEAQFQMQNAKLAGRNFGSTNVPAYFDQSTPTPLTYNVTTGSAAPTTLPMEYDKTKSWIVVNDSNRVRSSANNIEMCQFIWNGEVSVHGTSGIAHTITDVSAATFDFFHVYYYTKTGSGGATSDRALCGYFSIQSSLTYDSYINYEQFVACRQIDFLPSPVLLSGSGANVQDQGRYIDIDNYAEITAEQNRNYILVAAYSMTYTYSMEDVEAKRKIKA